MAFRLSILVHLPLIAPVSELSCRHECTVPSNERSRLKNFATNARLVVTVRRDPGAISPFSSLSDPQSNKNQSFSSNSPVSQKRNERPISPSLEVPKVNKRQGVNSNYCVLQERQEMGFP